MGPSHRPKFKSGSSRKAPPPTPATPPGSSRKTPHPTSAVTRPPDPDPSCGSIPCPASGSKFTVCFEPPALRPCPALPCPPAASPPPPPPPPRLLSQAQIPNVVPKKTSQNVSVKTLLAPKPLTVSINETLHPEALPDARDLIAISAAAASEKFEVRQEAAWVYRVWSLGLRFRV